MGPSQALAAIASYLTFAARSVMVRRRRAAVAGSRPPLYSAAPEAALDPIEHPLWLARGAPRARAPDRVVVRPRSPVRGRSGRPGASIGPGGPIGQPRS